MSFRSVAGAAVLLHFAAMATAQQMSTGSTLAKVRERGALLCGIDRSEAEYSSTDEHGNRAAFDRDLCTAVAVVALGPGARIIVTYYADDRTSMQALADGKADLIASLSVRRNPENVDAQPLPIAFSDPILHDAIGMMVPRSAGISDATQLSGRKICYLTETETEARLQAWFMFHHLDLLPFPFQEEGEMEAAFLTGNCAGLAGDLTRLAQTRASTGDGAKEYVLLMQTFGDDPLAMAYRATDPRWGRIVNATRNLLLSALDAGITQNSRPVNKRDSKLLQNTRSEAKDLELSNTWAENLITGVGNYREMYDRDLGDTSTLHMGEVWTIVAARIDH